MNMKMPNEKKKLRNKWAGTSVGKASCRKSSGFTLIELMVSIGIFLVIGGATMTLFQRHALLFAGQQNQANLNITLRNALSQLQMDVVNAGSGYYATANISSFPVGLTVQNVAGGFDTINIVSPDTTVPPAHPDGPGGCTTTTSGTMLLIPVAGLTAANFNTGDELLLMTGGTTGSGRNQMTTVTLLGPGATAAGEIQLTYTATSGVGINPTDTAQLTTNADTAIGELGIQFCSSTDWVVKLAPPVIYTVNGANQLTRAQGATTNIVADQIVGFKVGTSAFSNVNNTSGTYTYTNTTKYDEIRSVRISLSGRTVSNSTDSFRNTFDGQPYKIEALSTVINPRNLSMN
jgi:prepilin-type N-terminal cleavage/methylation domain-containing protein